MSETPKPSGGAGFRSGNARRTEPEPLTWPVADWDLWGSMPKATLREAVLLSVGCEARPTRTAEAGCATPALSDPGPEFHRRLTLACACLSVKGPLRPLEVMQLLRPHADVEVSLPEFWGWAEGQDWHIPKRIPHVKARALATETAPAARAAGLEHAITAGDSNDAVRTDPQYWEAVLKDPSAHGFSAEAAVKLRYSIRTRGSPQMTPDEAAELIFWHDAALHANHWFSLKDVEPGQAAMVMCGFHPNKQTPERARQDTTDATGPDDFVRLLQRFEDLAKHKTAPRTLPEWLAFALEEKLRYHPWLDDYLEAIRLTRGDAAPTEPAAGVEAPAADQAPAENKAARQDRRLLACEAAGLTMPASPVGRLPDGIGRVAQAEGVTRQAFTEDLRAALKRRAAASREGTTRRIE